MEKMSLNNSPLLGGIGDLVTKATRNCRLYLSYQIFFRIFKHIKTIKMDKLEIALEQIQSHQRELMELMGREKCNDFNSVLRANSLARLIIELEVEIKAFKRAMILSK